MKNTPKEQGRVIRHILVTDFDFKKNNLLLYHYNIVVISLDVTVQGDNENIVAAPGPSNVMRQRGSIKALIGITTF